VPPTIYKAIVTCSLMLKPAASTPPPLRRMSDVYHAGLRNPTAELGYRRFCASAAQDEKPIGP
jgi:hypothetical protein